MKFGRIVRQVNTVCIDWGTHFWCDVIPSRWHRWRVDEHLLVAHPQMQRC